MTNKYITEINCENVVHLIRKALLFNDKLEWVCLNNKIENYNREKLSQFDIIRYEAENEDYTFTLIVKDKKYNMEIKYKSDPGKFYELPYIEDDQMQKTLAELQSLNIKPCKCQ